MIATLTEINETAESESVEIRPQPKQEAFLASPADLTLFGGGAFGGKTYAALLELLRWIHLPNYRGVIFRRTRPRITQEGGLWDESQALYRAAGGIPNSGRLLWRFPSGAVVGFKQCERDDDVYNYKGLQADVIIFDQVEEFTAKQFWYLFSRNRGSTGIRAYCRATFNPEPGWLADFLKWWWDERSGYAIEERGGTIRWFGRVDDKVHWSDDPRTLMREYGHRKDFKPRSCTFIPAKADDNPIGLEKNPDYKPTLMSMRRVDMERLLKGNFKIRDDEGAEWPTEYFDDIWADDWPDGFELSAVTVDSSEGTANGDPSAIIFTGFHKGRIYVDSDIRRRPVPEIVADAASMAVAYSAHSLTFEGNGFQKLIAPEYDRYVLQQSLPIPSADLIENYGVKKEVRIQRLGGWLRGKRLKLRRTKSNDILLEHLQVFPMGDHDDGPDALEMGIRQLNKMAADVIGRTGDEVYQP